jgi:acetolactate synthase-1/2/3 large subunit
MKLSDYVMQRLSEHVDTVYYVPGGGCMHLVESLGNSGMKAFSMLHEQGAAFAACGYAAYKGLGVVLTTSGPGATNAITGVAAAWMDGYPVLAISGQVQTKTMMTGLGLRSFGSQEIDIVGMVQVITKYAVTVMKPEDIKDVMNHAIALAINGRQGPVWLDIPLDVQAREI